MSAESPLVTEWPASEKAHLESLTSGQAIAVEYSGCELRIVDACRLAGKYTWQKTTIATDTVEIRNADELYSKLPIGAVNLEAELQRSGRLAVRTSVAGQLKLGEIDTSAVPREGPCAKATHVVSAVSIGAFKLLSGGAVNVRGSVGVGGAGAGGGASRAEEIVRQAGDSAKCNDATPEAPNGECASPIQLFLQPIQRTKTPEELRAEEAEKQAQKTGGLRVTFRLPDDARDQRWTLRDSTGLALCDLPCTRWVPPSTGYYLEKEEARNVGRPRIDVPAATSFTSGSDVDALVRPAKGSVVLPWFVIVPSAAALAGGTALFVIGNGKKNYTCFYEDGTQNTESGVDSCSSSYGGSPLLHFKTENDHTLVPLGLTVAGLGLVGLVGGIYWFATSNRAAIEMKPHTTGAWSPRIIGFTPAGIVGEF